MTGTTGGARFVRCHEARGAPAGCVGKKVPQSIVILGLDPRIHEETGTVPVVRWIAGSKSGNNYKRKNPRVTRMEGRGRKCSEQRK